jgi:phospholipase C
MFVHRKRASALLILSAAILVPLCSLAGCKATLNSGSPTVSPVAGSPIQYVVVVMQENRSFDNLFNGFPGADSVQVGMSLGTPVPLVPISLADPRDLDHSHPGWWQDLDNGKMDGFARSNMNPPTFAYAYVPHDEIQAYWTMAQQYVLGDRMFQSNTGPSFPAHLYMIAGQSGLATEAPDSDYWGCDAPAGTTVPVLGPDGTDLLPGVFPCWDYATAADLLDAKGMSWRYYASASTNPLIVGSAYDAIRHIRYGADWNANVIYPQTQFLTDVQNGHLAEVTWVTPDYLHSDHPGTGSAEGPDWVAAVVNAVGLSKFWNSTAIFITWDDWGGWYDHVLPPTVDAMGPGFRVPVLVVSPYAKQAYISHQEHEASGFIAFIEHNWGLGNLGARDATADDFADCFDYTQKARPFILITTKTTADALIKEKPSGPPDDD